MSNLTNDSFLEGEDGNPSSAASGLMGLFAGGILISVLLAFIYSLFCFYNPFVHFNIFAPIVFGGLIMFSVSNIAAMLKVRSVNAMRAGGFVSGLAGMYAAWVWYIYAITKFKVLMLNPYGLARATQALAVTGVWTFYGFRPTGIGLYVIWIAEAVCVVLISSQAPPLKFQFCEGCNEWIDEKGKKVRLAWIDVNQLKADLARNDYQFLNTAQAAPADAGSYLEIEVKQCQQCLNEAFVSIESNKTTTSDDGSTSADAAIVCISKRVPGSVATSILKRAE